MSARPAPARAWLAAAAELARSAGGRGNALRGLVVHDLVLGPGRFGGRVRAARERDVTVEVSWELAADPVWEGAIERLAARARCFVALLEGDVDADLEDELAGSGIVLVPPVAAMSVRCERDGVRWCAHARALHQAAATRVGREPALLLELAGRPRDVLLARIRATNGIEVRTAEGSVARCEDAGGRTDLNDVVVSPAPPEDPTAVLDGLGPPPGLEDTAALAAIVRRAARFAWAIAAGEGEDVADRALLLATLRAGGTMTASELASALGASEERVGEELERLHVAGAVLRTGSATLRRYRAR